MMKQTPTGVEEYDRMTRRAKFLKAMGRSIPWPEMMAAIETTYAKIGESGGRPSVPLQLERMLPMYFVQRWFDLSGPLVDEAPIDQYEK
jgi:hypothetical protein